MSTDMHLASNGFKLCWHARAIYNYAIYGIWVRRRDISLIYYANHALSIWI